MPKIVNAKPGKLSLKDGFYVAGLKVLTERFLSGFVGNGNYMSGAVKLGSAIGVNKLVGGDIGSYTSTALVVDGTEDVVRNLTKLVNLGQIMPGASSQQQENDVL